MIALSESELPDLARYPASLQQAALALWSSGLVARLGSRASSSPADGIAVRKTGSGKLPHAI